LTSFVNKLTTIESLKQNIENISGNKMNTLRHKTIFYFLVFIFSCLLNISAGAWGSTGHRAVAEIAWQHLSKKSKSKISTILGDSYLPLYATWADDIRSEKNNPLGKVPHYINMEFTESYETAAKSENGDLITVLTGMIDQFSNPAATHEEKAESLKFIIHLVGDLHQPMHIGLAEDLGGNRVHVKWFNEDSNLHKVWDENIVDFSRLSYTELARFAGYPDAQDRRKLEEGSLVDWSNETHQITKTIYNHLDNKEFSYQYYYQFYPVVVQQIQKAGYRLAYLLDQLLATQ